MANRPQREAPPRLLAPELLARVRQIQIRTRIRASGALQGAYRSNFRGTGIEFEEVRPYQPGDDVRSIDWNVTARTGNPHVKTYMEERQLVLQLLVDTSRSMDFGSREKSKRETAAEVAALLAFVAAAEQDQVGLCLFDEAPGLFLPPKKDHFHLLRLVREVMAAPAGGSGSSLGAVLEHQLRHLKRRALVFVVSDFLSVGNDAWEESLAPLARKHDVIAVRVTDPFEEELPAAGRIPLVDLESGHSLEVDTSSKSVRDRWRQAALERRARLEERLRSARVDLVEVSTAGDLVQPLEACFRRRAMGGGA